MGNDKEIDKFIEKMDRDVLNKGMSESEIGYLFDMLESLNQRMIRTESKLTALMNHLNLSAQGVPIDPAYSGHSKNPRAHTTGAAQGRRNKE